jgi:hypothetical protein
MAASRFSRVSRARYTSPMPAASAGGTISYGPSFVPEATVIGARNYNPRWTLRLWRIVGKPETGFEETSAGSAFDRTTLPPSRLLARHNFRVDRHPPAIGKRQWSSHRPAHRYLPSTPRHARNAPQRGKALLRHSSLQQLHDYDKRLQLTDVV